MKETLRCNGYPERFLFPLECHRSRKDTEDKDDPRSHVTIPYIQGVSEAVTRILSNINVQVHMKPFRNFRKILSHPKDRIPDDDKSNVVYKINCRDCDASYVGETGRALKTRVSEHRRGVEKMNFSGSALAQPAWENHHHIDWTSTCILGMESHYTAKNLALFSHQYWRISVPNSTPTSYLRSKTHRWIYILCLVINIQIYVVVARPIFFFTMLLRAFMTKEGAKIVHHK